jgi:hypothetical protein
MRDDRNAKERALGYPPQQLIRDPRRPGVRTRAVMNPDPDFQLGHAPGRPTPDENEPPSAIAKATSLVRRVLGFPRLLGDFR